MAQLKILRVAMLNAPNVFGKMAQTISSSEPKFRDLTLTIKPPFLEITHATKPGMHLIPLTNVIGIKAEIETEAPEVAVGMPEPKAPQPAGAAKVKTAKKKKRFTRRR